MSRIVAIHQPNFFPWLGYLNKIVRSDVFILLDDVQHPKTGGSWLNRVGLLISGEKRWLSASIDRNYHGFRKIYEIEYIQKDKWREKALRSIKQSYGRHPHFRECMEIIEPLLCNPEANLSEYNSRVIMTLCHTLSIDASKILKSSKIPHEGASTDLLCSIAKAVGCDTYMCGGGAAGYQNEDTFAQSGVNLVQQNFSHPIYPQFGMSEFIPGLSVIDAAMNVGWSNVRKLISN